MTDKTSLGNRMERHEAVPRTSSCKPRRKLWYWFLVPGLWWSREHRTWTTLDNLGSQGGSSNRIFRTVERALSHAEGLMQRGFQVSVIRVKRIRGRSYVVREWANCEWYSDEAQKINLERVA